MCDPCWRGTPDQAWTICNTVDEVLVEMEPSKKLVSREMLVEALGKTCNRTAYLQPDVATELGAEQRLLELDIEVRPRKLMLTELEVNE